jgi:hypothetical protein
MALRKSFNGGVLQQYSVPGGMAGNGSIADERMRELAGSSSGIQQDAPIYRYGGVLTYEKPITEFFADILIPVASSVALRAGNELPRNCVGMRFVALIPNVTASINGGGPRTILNGDVLSGCEINSIVVTTDAAGTCIVQPVGTGD